MAPGVKVGLAHGVTLGATGGMAHGASLGVELVLGGTAMV